MGRFTLNKLLGAFLIFSFAACNSDENGSKDDNNFSSRMTYKNEILQNYQGLTLQNGHQVPTMRIRLIAEIEPPTVRGKLLQTTSFLFDTNRNVYVSYNNKGPKQIGSIEQIFLPSYKVPVLVSYRNFPRTDINQITRDHHHLYAVGAKQNVGAHLKKIRLGFARRLLKTVRTTLIPSFAGTGIASVGENLFISSGDQGGLLKMEKSSLEEISYNEVQDLRDVQYNKWRDEIVTVRANPFTFERYNLNNELIAEHVIGGFGPEESKSTIQTASHKSLISTGPEGARLVCNDSGEVLSTIEPTLRRNGQRDVINSAAACGEFIFTANGYSGVQAFYSGGQKFEAPNCQSSDPVYLSSLSLGDNHSANHIYTNHRYLFVASGKGGFSILKVEIENEDDDGLEPNSI